MTDVRAVVETEDLLKVLLVLLVALLALGAVDPALGVLLGPIEPLASSTAAFGVR